jgi:dephospho-CoA kinase
MPSGELDRNALRSRVFTDGTDRRRLEAILHPRIRDIVVERSATLGGPYQIIVVPLLIETDFQQLVDRILVVDCPESLQRERLIARDDEDAGQVDRIMSAQLNRKERLRSADDVIDNTGTREQTRRQVEALHRRYLRLAGAK